MADAFIQGVRGCLQTNDGNALASYFAPLSDADFQRSLKRQLAVLCCLPVSL